MIQKLFGVLDMLAAIAIALFGLKVISPYYLVVLASYLLLKAIIFWGDLMSIIDGAAGLYMIMMIFFSIPLVSILFGIYLFAKGLWSLY